MEKSTQELSDFVNRVLNVTRASKVDIVGHSQGSLIPRYWMKNLGGVTKVRKFAGLVVDPICEACLQYKEFVTPYTNGFLRDKNPRVRNQVLQDWCQEDMSEHTLLAFNPIVFSGIHAFLDPSADQNISCLDVLLN
ncbi:hypothetical protein BGX33_009500 [Mortierella sp. NVP41]|nr:hypothetical protein BGX33_009500 [Mortierella sp. NVP41]